MDKFVVTLPKFLTLNSALTFIEELSLIPNAQKIVFDCSEFTHVEPFSMLLAANGIKAFKKSRRGTAFATRNRTFNPYANHMGFFKHAGLSNTEDYEKRGSSRYLAIAKIDCDEVREQAYEDGCHPCDIIEDDASRIAEVLVRDNEGDLFDLFKFTTLEMMRNVIEHSEAKSFHYCAQYWPSKDKVEIGFLDSGIGLKRSLEKNPSISNITDDQALNLALTPGVSSTVYGPGGGKGKWTNAGYGLYMTSRFCCEGGSFSLLSGSFGVLKNSSKSDLIEAGIGGTGVRMILRPSKIKSLQKMFDSFRADADKIAKERGSKPIGLSPSTILKRSKKNPIKT